MQKALKISQSNDVSSVSIFGFFEKQIQKMKIFFVLSFFQFISFENIISNSIFYYHVN